MSLGHKTILRLTALLALCFLIFPALAPAQAVVSPLSNLQFTAVPSYYPSQFRVWRVRNTNDVPVDITVHISGGATIFAGQIPAKPSEASYYEMYVTGPQGTAILTWYNDDGTQAGRNTKSFNSGTATLNHALSAAPTSRIPGTGMTFTLTNPNSASGGYVPTTWTLTDLAGAEIATGSLNLTNGATPLTTPDAACGATLTLAWPSQAAGQPDLTASARFTTDDCTPTIQAPTLTSACAYYPTQYLNWQLTNPNPTAMDVYYVHNSTVTGLNIPAGPDGVLNFSTAPDLTTLDIVWSDDYATQSTLSLAADTAACPLQPLSLAHASQAEGDTVTWTLINPNDPAYGPINNVTWSIADTEFFGTLDVTGSEITFTSGVPACGAELTLTWPAQTPDGQPGSVTVPYLPDECAVVVSPTVYLVFLPLVIR